MFTINTDQGLGFIKRGNQVVFDVPEKLDYSFYVKNANELMNVVNVSNSLNAINKLHQNGF
jgi:hypothetical protein